MAKSRKLGKALKKATRPTKEESVCFDASLIEEYNRIKEAGRRDRLSSGVETELAALQSKIDEVTVKFTLQALDRRRWDALVREHPPRPDNKDDNALGYNPESFYGALIRESIIAPDIDDDEWAQIDEVLTLAQWNRLAIAAQSLNLAESPIPLSRPV